MKKAWIYLGIYVALVCVIFTGIAAYFQGISPAITDRIRNSYRTKFEYKTAQGVECYNMIMDQYFNAFFVSVYNGLVPSNGSYDGENWIYRVTLNSGDDADKHSEIVFLFIDGGVLFQNRFYTFGDVDYSEVLSRLEGLLTYCKEK